MSAVRHSHGDAVGNLIHFFLSLLDGHAWLEAALQGVRRVLESDGQL